MHLFLRIHIRNYLLTSTQMDWNKFLSKSEQVENSRCMGKRPFRVFPSLSKWAEIVHTTFCGPTEKMEG